MADDDRGQPHDGTGVVVQVGAVLAEQHDEWADRRRYRAQDVFGRSRLTALPDIPELTTDPLPALSA